jgi:hypothetical protein
MRGNRKVFFPIVLLVALVMGVVLGPKNRLLCKKKTCF